MGLFKLRGAVLPVRCVSQSLRDIPSMDIGRSDFGKNRDAVIAVLKKYHFADTENHKDILHLLKAALLFNYNDKAFWTSLNTAITKNLSRFPRSAKVALTKLLLHFGKQHEPSFRTLVDDLLGGLEKVGAEDVVDVAIADLRGTRSKVKELEKAIVGSSGSIEAGKLCEFLYELYLAKVPMKHLMLHLKSRILTNIEELPKSAYKSILLAYGYFCPTEYAEILEAIESQAMICMDDFTFRELVDLIGAFADYQSGSKELFLAFDKRIGMQIDQMYPLDIAPVLAAFARRGHYRDKLFIHYIRKIKSLAHLLPIDHLASLVETYAKIGLLSKLHGYLLPFIIKDKTNLDSDSLIRVLYGYFDSKLKERAYREMAPVALELLKSCSFFQLARVGYAFALAGNEDVARAALERLEEVNDNSDAIGTMHCLEIAVRYKTRDEIVDLIQSLVKRHIEKYDKEDLAIICQCAAGDERLKDILKHIPGWEKLKP